MQDQTIEKANQWHNFIEGFAAILLWLKTSKMYLWVVGSIAWVTSTYVNLIPALGFFLICTTLDTLSRIDVTARQKNVKFRPWTKTFWFQIEPDLLMVWFDKVFKQYLIYVLIAYIFDVIILKSKLHFDIYVIKLDIPTCLVLFFSAVELLSAFKGQEELGRKNYIKIIFKIFSSFIPEKVRESISKTIEETDTKPKIKKG